MHEGNPGFAGRNGVATESDRERYKDMSRVYLYTTYRCAWNHVHRYVES